MHQAEASIYIDLIPLHRFICHVSTRKSPVVTMPIISNPEASINKSVDCLVAGGESAGLFVAARFTEDPNVTVGVNEAGPA